MQSSDAHSTTASTSEASSSHSPASADVESVEILFKMNCLECRRDYPEYNFCTTKELIHACCPPTSENFFCVQNEEEEVHCNHHSTSLEMYYASCPMEYPSKCGVDDDNILHVLDKKDTQVYASYLQWDQAEVCHYELEYEWDKDLMYLSKVILNI